MAKLTWEGHACFKIETGKHNIWIDPFLSGNPLAKTKPEQVKADFILVTHGHGDHLGDTIAIAKRTKATVIAPFELAMYCQMHGAPNVHPMHIGGGHHFPFGHVKLTIAHHGSAMVDKEITYTGNPCGFLVTSEGKTIYHAGDTGLFGDMALIGQMQKIKAALLPIGDNFTMGPDDAVKAVELLKPEIVIPMHYNTFEVINQNPQEFVRKVKGATVVILEPGKSFEI